MNCVGQAGVECGEGVSMRGKFEKVVRIILSKQKGIVVDKCKCGVLCFCCSSNFQVLFF